MRTYETVQWGPDRLRIGPWRGDPAIAELAPVVAGRSPDPRNVARGVELLTARGFRSVVTGALAPEEQVGYLGAGFAVHERLHLLAHDLHHLPPPPPVRLRRARRRDRADVLAVDHAAFAPFWRLDERGLDDALRATPSSRLRVAAHRAVGGYAITGRAASRGYLQRLAVHPGHQGSGLGAALVLDALLWLRRRGCRVALVNTQEANERAFRLYRRLGFVPRADGLAVLRYDVDGVAT
jgi:GNAT superfamily N-acetyltransferase